MEECMEMKSAIDASVQLKWSTKNEVEVVDPYGLPLTLPGAGLLLWYWQGERPASEFIAWHCVYKSQLAFSAREGVLFTGGVRIPKINIKPTIFGAMH